MIQSIIDVIKPDHRIEFIPNAVMPQDLENLKDVLDRQIIVWGQKLS